MPDLINKFLDALPKSISNSTKAKYLRILESPVPKAFEKHEIVKCLRPATLGTFLIYISCGNYAVLGNGKERLLLCPLGSLTIAQVTKAGFLFLAFVSQLGNEQDAQSTLNF
jgi:hypothetical protein